jgi:hypothetical protein
MIVPKGQLIEIVRGSPKDSLSKIRYGYLKISWKDENDLYSACVVLSDGKPILADLEGVKSKTLLKGKEALDRILNLDYGVVEIYSVEKRDIPRIISMNDTATKVEIETKEKLEEIATEREGAVEERPKEEVIKKKEVVTVEEKEEDPSIRSNVEEFIFNLKEDFSGMVSARGEDRDALIYVKNGKIIGVKVLFNNNEEYKGLSALYYLDFDAKIVVKELDDVERFVDESLKVELITDKEKIIKKYNIKIPDENEIEEILKTLQELSFEEKRFKDKLIKFFKKIKK